MRLSAFVEILLCKVLLESTQLQHLINLKYFPLVLSNLLTSIHFLLNHKLLQSLIDLLLHPVQTLNQILFHVLNLVYNFLYQLYLQLQLVLSLVLMLYQVQNEFVALALQKRQPITKLHPPFLKHALLHHQNQRDLVYLLH